MAVSIPIFTSQLEKSREATDLANLRAAYAEASVEALLQDTPASFEKYYTSAGQLSDTQTDGITGKATQSGFQGPNPGLGWSKYAGEGKDGYLQVKFDSSNNTVTANFVKKS